SVAGAASTVALHAVTITSNRPTGTRPMVVFLISTPPSQMDPPGRCHPYPSGSPAFPSPPTRETKRAAVRQGGSYTPQRGEAATWAPVPGVVGRGPWDNPRRSSGGSGDDERHPQVDPPLDDVAVAVGD